VCCEAPKKKSRKRRSYKYEKPATIMDATAMSIAEMQAVDDMARPIEKKSLLPRMQDFEVDSEATIEIEIEHCKGLFLSVDNDCDEVEAKIDQNGNLVIKLKEEYRCCGFEGTANIEVRASTGIERSECDFSQIIEQNRYDVEAFKVVFKPLDCDGCCTKDLSLYKSTHLSFERGRLYVREDGRKYLTEVLYEIGKLIYVKNGVSHIYPTEKNSKFDITQQQMRESKSYMTPLFHDDGKVNPCFKKGKPTGLCARGTITMTQDNYYAPVTVTYLLDNLRPGQYHAVAVYEYGAINLKGAYHNPGINGEEYQPFGKRYGFLLEAKGNRKGEFELCDENKVINMFEPFSVMGRAA
jgi:hypothetical protein